MRTKLLRSVLLALVFALMCGPALAKKSDKLLTVALYEYSGAIRWGEFQRAYDYVDPEVRSEHPLSDTDLARYKQVEVTHYEVTASTQTATTADRQVQVSLVNRHTQAERSISYHEHWRWDEKHKSWWLTTGLPDITASNGTDNN